MEHLDVERASEGAGHGGLPGPDAADDGDPLHQRIMRYDAELLGAVLMARGGSRRGGRPARRSSVRVGLRAPRAGNRRASDALGTMAAWLKNFERYS